MYTYQKSMEDSRFKSAGALSHSQALRRVLAAERREQEPEGPGKLSTSTSVDSVRGPGLP